MPWNGIGTFSRFYGASGWTDDKNNGVKILSSHHDTHDQDLADGINACITRDNQAKPTASFLPSTDNAINLGSATFRWALINGQTPVLAGQSNVFAQSNSSSAFQTFQNTSTGTGATSVVQVLNSAHGVFLNIASTLYSGTLLTGSPTGESAALSTNSSLPLSIGTNATERIRIAGDGSLINLQATAMQMNGVDITASTSTFTATLASGLTTTPSGTLTYKKIGNVVTLYNNSGSGIQGTSNSSSWTITGFPAAILPLAGTRTIPCFWTDNSLNIAGFLQLTTSTGTPNSNTGVFTASGTKGIPAGWSVTYSL